MTHSTNPTHPATDAVQPRWHGLYLAAAAGAALTALCIPLQVLFYIAWPPPASRAVADWFALFNQEPVRGLLSMDLVMMVEQVLLVPIVIALWMVVRRAGPSLALLGAALWLGGGFLLVGSNTAFEMLALARGYDAAATDAARAGYLAAGQGMMATYFDMGTGFVFGYILTSIGGITMGVAMLRTAGWKLAGRILIAGTALGLCIFLPVVGIGLSLVSVLVLVAWFVLIAVRFARMARVPDVGVTAPALSPAPAPAVTPAHP